MQHSHKLNKYFVFFAINLFASAIIAGQSNSTSPDGVMQLDSVFVTASRIPLGLQEIGQPFTVITAAEIAQLPVFSVAAALSHINGIDVRQRGAGDTQADISIRGSTFEQTLILIDGIVMRDPQTGHHNMNLPVSLSEIDRIEVIKGAAARVYGVNAMGGVINIITKQQNDHALVARVDYGSFSFRNADLYAPWRWRATSHRFSVGWQASDGYLGKGRNDFQRINANYRFAWQANTRWRIEAGGGLSERDFGAHRFYSNSLEDERENTATYHLWQKMSYASDDFYLHQRGYHRRGSDYFSYRLAGDDALFANSHTSDTYGGQLDAGFATRLGKSNIGLDYSHDQIASTNLGNHNRYRWGITLEQRGKLSEKLNYGAGLSAILTSQYGQRLWPGADISLQVSPFLQLRVAADRALRIPTFTELYYQDPGNRGNPDLQPEESTSLTIESRLTFARLQLSAGLFHKQGTNFIDYFRYPENTYFIATNSAKVILRGLDAEMRIFPMLNLSFLIWEEMQMAYTFIDSDVNRGIYESKYLLQNLQHQLLTALHLRYGGGIRHHTQLRLQQRVDEAAYLILDSRVQISWQWLRVYLAGKNLLDAEYVLSGFAPMPGRTFTLGMEIVWPQVE
jgi:vitamin B12 transporter